MIPLTSAWAGLPSAEASAPVLASFQHPKNLNVGMARVVWAGECVVRSGARLAAGWVLPGGERTTDALRASAVAQNMNMIMSSGYAPIYR